MSFLSHFTWYIIVTQLRPSTVSFICEEEPPPPISTPWGPTGHKAASRHSEPIWNAHYPPTHHHCQVPMLHLGEVSTHGVHILPKDVTAQMGPSYISHYGAMPADSHPSCINWARDCLTSVIKRKAFVPCYVSPHFKVMKGVSSRFESILVVHL